MLVVDPATSLRLSKIPQRNTKVEIFVRQALHSRGVRFRIENRDLPGNPDIANRSRRWAVFVHGCFWHAHAGCPRATVPKRNRRFWVEKLDANRKRDRRSVRILRRAGFTVIIVWECKASDLLNATTDLYEAVNELARLRMKGPSRRGIRQ